MTERAEPQNEEPGPRGWWPPTFLSRVLPVVQWVLLIVVAAILITIVDPSIVESPYNGF